MLVSITLIFLIVGAYTTVHFFFSFGRLTAQKAQIARQLKELDKRTDEASNRIAAMQADLDKQIAYATDTLNEVEATLTEINSAYQEDNQDSKDNQ